MTVFKLMFHFFIKLIIVLSFINKISANNCDFNVKITQNLLGEGFHRNITYAIEFDNKIIENEFLYKDCVVALDQVLPAGLYTNADDLDDLRRTGRMKAYPQNRINIEAPAEYSEPSKVLIVGKMKTNKLDLWIPVHARYHQAMSGGGMVRNLIALPVMFLHCLDSQINDCDNPLPESLDFLCRGVAREKCNWKDIPYTSLSDTLVWYIPIGNVDHVYVVGIITTFVMLMATLHILRVIHDYNMELKKKRN